MVTYECVKDIIHLRHRLSNLDVIDITSPTVVYNKNCACCDWVKKTTTKGLKHLNLQENLVRECQKEYFSVQIQHIAGNINSSDIITKSLQDITHFRTLRNSFM